MNIEFHYYITKYLALEAGFDKGEAEIIAYSSQYVDDNFIPFKIKTPENDIYKNFISQTPDITNPEKKLIRMHLLYHYLPGTPTSTKVSRKDGKMHLLMTTPASNYSQEIFFETTKSEDLFSLGIATHMLADTFCHQNFVGTFDEINSMTGVWETSKHHLGHADAQYKPDIPNLIWHDPRLIDENATIDNTERILFAAKKLYSNFLLITSMDEGHWSKVKKSISDIIKPTITEPELAAEKEQKKERIIKYNELFAEFKAEDEYNPLKWLDDTIEEDILKKTNHGKELTFKKDFEKSNWYKFQEALKFYEKISMGKLAPLFAQMELKEL